MGSFWTVIIVVVDHSLVVVVVVVASFLFGKGKRHAVERVWSMRHKAMMVEVEGIGIVAIVFENLVPCVGSTVGFHD
jgi:hypothetical protein